MNSNKLYFPILFLAFVAIFQPFICFAQSANVKTMESHAKTLFDKREYEQAFDYYMKLKELRPKKNVFKYRAGVCAIYKGDAPLAVALIKSAYDVNPSLVDVNFFLGRAYLLNNSYDEAVEQFNLQMAKETNPTEKLKLKQYLVNCLSAKAISATITNNKVINAGTNLNSAAEEFAPMLYNNDMNIIFTYKGLKSTGGKSYTFGKTDSAGFYHEDIFQSSLQGSKWVVPIGLSTNLNTVDHDAATSLSPDSRVLYLYRGGSNDGGDIYWSKRLGKYWTVPDKLKGDINKAGSWEGSVAISKDGHTIYFSSNRMNGFGGKDIYSAELEGDTAFVNVKNLGTNVNTPYDDDAPFLTNNESTLYFSSRGHNSIGGYDVFFSALGSDGVSWELAQNMGSPINSTADDIYYQSSKDGYSAVYSSNRAGGNGMMDLYFATPGVPSADLLTIFGKVTLDGKPVGATVTVAYNNKKDIQGDYNASAENGRYTINLPKGEDYKLFYLVNGLDDFSKTYDATQVKTYTTHEINVEFFSDEYKMKHPEKFGKVNVSDSLKIMKEQNATVMIDSIRTVKDLVSNFNFENSTAPVDTGFYVVVGTFKNLDYAKRMEAKVKLKKQYPKVQLVYNNKSGFTHVTVGRLTYMEDAIILTKEARKEYLDSWVQSLR